MKYYLVDLYQVCSNYAPEAKKNGPSSGVTCFKYANIPENMKKSSCLKPQGLDIWYAASLSGPLPSLFTAPGAKNGPAPGVTCFNRLILGKHEKIVFSETTKHRALILGMKHHLVDIYQVSSNYAPGANNQKKRHRALIFGMYYQT